MTNDSPPSRRGHIQDMHYAEFAEDEVSNFVRLTAIPCSPRNRDWLTGVRVERGAAAGDQGLRE